MNLDTHTTSLNLIQAFSLTVQLTPDNSNQSRISLDFLLTFTVILPSVARTIDNSNLALTRSNFCFPSGHFYTILPSITRTML